MNSEKDHNLQLKKTVEMIKQLFRYFCMNEGFCIIFCYLTGLYGLVNRILKHIALNNILDRVKIKSFLKASNLFECYNLNHFKMDIMNNQTALKSYLGFLMVLPSSKINKSLLNRLT